MADGEWSVTKDGSGKWFVITGGKHTGRARMSGWSRTSIPTSLAEPRWVELAHCPRCYAMVLADEDWQGDQTWAHEQWHAKTDHPIPDDVLAKVTRP